MENNLLPSVITTIWADQGGNFLKTSTSLLGGITTFRVSKEEALLMSKAPVKDLGASTLIRTDRVIPQPNDTVEVVYRLSTPDGKAAAIFPQDERQKVTKNERGEVLLSVRRIEMDSSQAQKQSVPPEFLTPNLYLQSAQEPIMSLSRKIVAGEMDSWIKAKKLEKWVFEHVKNSSNRAASFPTALEVTKTLEGDCKAYAVLLAALARAEGIPARIVVGLRYMDQPNPAFGGHMWTEVYVNGKWVALDGTLGQGYVGATHIKLADSSLAGADAATVFLPMLFVPDKLKIEIVSWK